MTDRADNLAPLPRLALTRAEAAAALGMSLDSFERRVQPELRIVRRGSLRLVPVAEPARWADEAAELTLPIRHEVDLAFGRGRPAADPRTTRRRLRRTTQAALSKVPHRDRPLHRRYYTVYL